MLRKFALAVSVLLLCAAPAMAGTLQIWENSLGSPGVTAQFPTGTSLFADLYYDADSAEGGAGLPFGGASEISITPFDFVSFVGFQCAFAGCTEGNDYTFVSGASGSLTVSDTNAGAQTGSIHIGTLEFDASGIGGIQLEGCNYTDGNGTERTCDPFTLVQTVPEPGTGALLGLALVALALARRRA